MKAYRLLPLILLMNSCSVLSPVKDTAIYHVLEPLLPERPLTLATPSIAINRSSIPAYLNRQQLITRSGGQLMISNLHLWGEPIEAAISRVTASNLSRLTGSTCIQPVENFTAQDYTYLLELRIIRFDQDTSNHMILEGTWQLQPVAGSVATRHYFRISTVVEDSQNIQKARVNGMNQCLEQLARKITAHP
jgi:uncharacterized protein